MRSISCSASSTPRRIRRSAYKNVVRMQLLIFFFAGAAAIKLDSYIVYAVVLCVYFFPFKALFGSPPSPEASGSERGNPAS